MKMPSDELPPIEDQRAQSAEIEPALPGAESVRAGLLRMGASSHHSELILWFLAYGVEIRGARTQGDLGALVGYTSSTISKILAGKYEGSLDNVAAKIRAFRIGAGVQLSAWPTAETRVSRDISSFCDAARTARQMALLWGPNQSGKSHALKSYAAAPRKGRTFYAFTPAGGGTRAFMLALAKACGLGRQANYLDICESIVGFLRPEDLLIIDEYHQVLIGRVLRTVTIERIKEIFEQVGCGIVLCGTDVLPKMLDDVRYRDLLAQTANRGALRRRIPPVPYKADIEAAFAAYGFPPLTAGEARDAATEVGRHHGLGQIFRQLQLAVILARNKKQPLALAHYVTTVRTMGAWAEGVKDNDQWTQEEAAQ